MNERAQQISLPIGAPVSPDVIARCRDMASAIQLSIQVAQLNQKQIYMALRMDKGHWSRVMSGELQFPADRLDALMDLTGNTIPLAWLAHRRGLGLHMLESEQQRQIRERDDLIKAQAEKLRYLEELITGRAKT